MEDFCTVYCTIISTISDQRQRYEMTKQLQYCHSYNRMVKTKELRSDSEMELRHLASSSSETDLPD